MTLNVPLFDVKRPEEDDIFVFSGFVPPGAHVV
jgi:hypothetical protein